jgi:DNA-binding PadR family transcriptional regulator
MERKKSYGYKIAECLPCYALTDVTIEGAALYRTLRTLEANGHVTSTWEEGGMHDDPTNSAAGMGSTSTTPISAT